MVRRVLCCLLVISVVMGCSDGGADEAEPSVTTAAPDASECDAPGSVVGDVDGDELPDTVFHQLDRGTAQLVVCSSAHGPLGMTGMGDADFLALGDVQDDEIAEIFYGTTEGDLTTVGIAVVELGALAPVIFEDTIDADVPFDGESLILKDGYPDGLPPEGPRLAYGCSGDTLMMLEITIETSLPWHHTNEVTDFELSGAIAHITGEDFYRYGNPLTEPSQLTGETAVPSTISLPTDPVELTTYVADALTEPC